MCRGCGQRARQFVRLLSSNVYRTLTIQIALVSRVEASGGRQMTNPALGVLVAAPVEHRVSSLYRKLNLGVCQVRKVLENCTSCILKSWEEGTEGTQA